jgi:NAD(P)-dependent dehydrogenase (short-subunit alcohol dehydrogenase family)
VRQLARSLIQRDPQLYTIVCNAGVQANDKTMTEDKFETTVGVNHVVHFLLVKLLQDRTQRIVMLRVRSVCQRNLERNVG